MDTGSKNLPDIRNSKVVDVIHPFKDSNAMGKWQLRNEPNCCEMSMMQREQI